MSGIDDFEKLSDWLEGIDLEADFLKFAADVDGIVPSAKEWEETKDYMMPQLKALVGRYSKLDDEAFYRFYMPVDDAIQAALTNPSVID